MDSSVLPLGVDLSPEQLAEVREMVLSESKNGISTISLLMRASADLKDKAFSPAPIEVRSLICFADSSFGSPRTS